MVGAAAEESGTLPESGGPSTSEPPEDRRCAASATVQSLVQTLFRWLPSRIQLAEVRLHKHQKLYSHTIQIVHEDI